MSCTCILIFLAIVILVITISLCVQCLINRNVENYGRRVKGFSLMKGFDFQNYYKVNTPLKPLISPLKMFEKDKVLPNIYIYNPKYFSPVRDQGSKCGGCWAFVICAMLSDSVTIKILKFGKNLNVQQLISCYPEDGCDGAAPEDALLWLEKNNFKISIGNQYLEVASKCEKSETGITVEKNSVKSLCEYIKRECIINPTQEESKLIKDNIYIMKMQLLKSGPFFGSISVYQDFFNFKGDKVYIKQSGQFIGGHAITIVGWCDKGVDQRAGFEEGYWVCKNSWSTNWAAEYDFPGYFAIKMGSNECGIEGRSGCAEANVEHVIEDKKIPSEFVFNKYIDLIKYVIENKKTK